MNETRAVLWDMDGTLIDSEDLHWTCWRDTMADEGVVITRQQFRDSFGQRNDAIISSWMGAALPPHRVESIGNAKEERYRHLVRTVGVSPLPGVAGWLRRLHSQGWLQAIASSAPRANVEAVLESLATAGVFQAIVSAEDVRRGKPDPEVFLTAAGRVGTSPDRCIVVEDAVAGIEAARNAGMKSIGVSPNGKHLHADVVVRSLDMLDDPAFDRLLVKPTDRWHQDSSR